MNCLDCSSSTIIDNYSEDKCSDDIKALICVKSKNPEFKVFAEWRVDKSPFRAVVRASKNCDLRKKSTQPEWCPLIS